MYIVCQYMVLKAFYKMFYCKKEENVVDSV